MVIVRTRARCRAWLGDCKCCHQADERHLGSDKQPGEGSTFSFSIDLSTATDSASAQTLSQPAAQNRHEKTLVGPRNILVVDDNAINLALLAAVVRQLGHSVDEAKDGSIAVGLAAMRAYDVILMDVNMPVMDGYISIPHHPRGWPVLRCDDCRGDSLYRYTIQRRRAECGH
ncbi:response regulator [Roseicyclus sp.]|uniref:response regulator n=1 Tax=Roseicyclus sp. TaxID=1914329 RepID=UPI001BCB110F|nr:response regulator [Roseicyclus sp.]